MLSTYFGALRRHNLWLDQIAEPLPAPGWDQAHDADRKPVFLVVRSIQTTGIRPVGMLTEVSSGRLTTPP